MLWLAITVASMENGLPIMRPSALNCTALWLQIRGRMRAYTSHRQLRCNKEHRGSFGAIERLAKNLAPGSPLPAVSDRSGPALAWPMSRVRTQDWLVTLDGKRLTKACSSDVQAAGWCGHFALLLLLLLLRALDNRAIGLQTFCPEAWLMPAYRSEVTSDAASVLPRHNAKSV